MRAVLLGSALCAAMAAAAAAANRTAEAAIRPAPGLAVARAAHTATLLSDGTVLVAGGCTGDSCELDSRGATTEVFQPKSGRFTPGPRLPAPIVGHSATRLADGKVLLAGGWDDSGLTDRAYLYDPGSRTFAATGSMHAARGGFTATRLRDGRVLFAGGSSNGAPLRSAELYDPASGRFIRTGSMTTARIGHVAAALGGGRILVAGGSGAGGRVLAGAELYDPRTGTFSKTGDMRFARHKHAAAPTAGGRILVVGGSDASDFRGRYASAELYDPASGRFRPVRPMAQRRFKLPDAVVGLASGAVLVAGGATSVERYDGSSRRFRTVGRLGAELLFSTATLLSDGQVLIAGGYDERIRLSGRTWLYRP